MISIDSRVGSVELVDHLPAELCNVTQLEFADFAFTGRGPKGVPWLVGIERKTVGDLISCIVSGRFSGHQVPGLLQNYNTVYLIVEGLIKCDLTNGVVKQRRGGGWEPVSYDSRQHSCHELIGYLNTITVKTGIMIWQTSSMRETAQYIKSLYRWWTVKDYDEHRAHIQPIRTMAVGKLDGIGTSKAINAAGYFGTVHRMVHAVEDDWKEVDGIGNVLAKRIVHQFNREGREDE